VSASRNELLNLLLEERWEALRDYIILRITAERDALAKRIADAPCVKEGDSIGTVLEALDNAIYGGTRVALVKVE
jgi:hypothetical protein